MNQENYAKLTTGKIGSTIIRLSIPMFFAIAGVVAFNLIDTYFVGKLGTLELAALGYVFPVVMALGSLGMGIGVGSSAVISRAIGEGDKEKVQRLTTDSLSLSFIVGVLFVIPGILTINPFFRFMGAPEAVLKHIRDYMIVWYLGNLFFIVPMVGNNAIRAKGETKIPSLIMIYSIIINAILDPLLIFGYGPFPRMEIQGAAAATVIARFCALIFSLYVLKYKYSMINLKPTAMRKILISWKSILYIGFPAMFTKLITPVSFGVTTGILSKYGPEVVAGFGISIKIEFFAIAIALCVSAVLGPFVGQNIGARKYDRAKESVRFCNVFSLCWGVIVFLILAIGSSYIGATFVDDPNVIPIVANYLVIVPIGYIFYGLLIMATMVLNILNKPYLSAGIVIIQMVVLYIPLSFLGSYLFGYLGTFYGILISYFLSGVFAHYVLLKNLP